MRFSSKGLRIGFFKKENIDRSQGIIVRELNSISLDGEEELDEAVSPSFEDLRR